MFHIAPSLLSSDKSCSRPCDLLSFHTYVVYMLLHTLLHALSLCFRSCMRQFALVSTFHVPFFCFLRSYVLSYDSPTEPPDALSRLYYISSHVVDCMHTIDIYHIHLYVSACHTFTPIATTSHHFQHIKRHKQQQLSHDYPRIMTQLSDHHESASTLSLVNPSALRRFQQLRIPKTKTKTKRTRTLNLAAVF